MKVKILDNNVRKHFFLKMKEAYNGKSFFEIGKENKISRSTFDCYRNGKFLLPERIFNKFVHNLNSDDRKLIELNIQKFPDNYGQIIGGKRAYKINTKKFEEGRKKGIISIKKAKAIDDLQLLSFLMKVKNSSEICEVIGAFIGDGCFNFYKNKLYYVGFSGDKRHDLNYYKEVIIPYIQKIFPNIRPTIKYVKNENTMQVVFYSKKLFYLLKEYFGFTPGKKTFTVAIPKRILNNEKFLRATIRGIFDTDGSVFFDKRKIYKSIYPRVVLQIKSKLLYHQLVNYLSRHFSLYNRFGSKRQIYIIEVYGKEQLKKWMSLIGFSNNRHLKKIREYAPIA